MLPKIVSAVDMRRWDAYTVEYLQIDALALMEKAANAFCNWLFDNYDRSVKITICCGTGNNGGDGLAIARILNQAGYLVNVYLLDKNNLTSDAQINLERLHQIEIIPQLFPEELCTMTTGDLIVDAFLGTGVNKPLTGKLLNIVNYINNLEKPIIAVDVPSGLFTEKPFTGVAIQATITISFERPKKCFLFQENYQYVGNWIAVPIGLCSDFENQLNENWHVINHEQVDKQTINRGKFDHKGSFGHAIIIAGSAGKFGAMVLSAKAALKSGCGLVSVFSHQKIGKWFHAAFPEAMIIQSFEALLKTKFNSLGIGPGLGTSNNAVQLLTKILSIKQPLVIDADAINIIAINKHLITQIPPNSILTPHPKELERLIGKFSNWKERIDYLYDWCERNQLIVVYKGAHTIVISSNRKLYANNTGCNGMATAGSGDVLTGMITSLLAQGYSPIDAAIRAVYYHGLAGEIAAEKTSNEALIASDIINNIGNAYQK